MDFSMMMNELIDDAIKGLSDLTGGKTTKINLARFLLVRPPQITKWSSNTTRPNQMHRLILEKLAKHWIDVQAMRKRRLAAIEKVKMGLPSNWLYHRACRRKENA
jgi:hypothetical protein